MLFQKNLFSSGGSIDTEQIKALCDQGSIDVNSSLSCLNQSPELFLNAQVIISLRSIGEELLYKPIIAGKLFSLLWEENKEIIES